MNKYILMPGCLKEFFPCEKCKVKLKVGINYCFNCGTKNKWEYTKIETFTTGKIEYLQWHYEKRGNSEIFAFQNILEKPVKLKIDYFKDQFNSIKSIKVLKK